MRAHGLGVASAVLIAVLVGCAPSPMLPAGEWAEEMGGRRLFHTPRGWVYASSAVAARDADETVRAAAEVLEKEGITAGKGVVIVVRGSDEPMGGRLRDVYIQGKRSRCANQSGEQVWDEVVKNAGARGVSVDFEIATSVVAMSGEDAARLVGAPERERPAWGVIMASRMVVEDDVRRTAAETMRESDGPGEWMFWAGYFAAVGGAWKESAVIRRDVLVLRAMGREGKGMEEEGWRRVWDGYERRLMRKRMGIFSDPRWWM